MATILKFDASERPANTAAPRRLRAYTSAEIVIFPGVRYEYWQEADTANDQHPQRERAKPGE